jgi:malonyl-CoA/methylmalonyl-CoA synthetase
MNPTRIHELLEPWLASDPDREFLHLSDGNVTYAELDAMAGALEGELRELGVRAGDRVVIVTENCVEHVALLLACSRVGGWSCGVNARMAPAEVDSYAQLADARIVYFTTGVSDAAMSHARRHHAQPSTLEGLLHGEVGADATAEEETEAERVAAIIFTSGTTGRSKGVMVTHAALLHAARVTCKTRVLGPEDRLCLFVPMTHIFGLAGLLAASLLSGATIVLRQAFSPADVLDALAHHRVTHLQGPPALFSRLLAHVDAKGLGRPPTPHLRYIYTGASPLDLALKQRVEACFGLPLHHGYASSESPIGFATKTGVWRDDTAAGNILEGMSVRIVGADDRDVAVGETGEIWLSGPYLMPGYFRDPEATRQAFRPGGWYASGDLGRMGEDGAIFIVGRVKEMIIRSGFNVYPAEIEAVLNQFPCVRRSAVLGQKEADGNERVVAFLELRDGAAFDEQGLRGYLREQLAPYKQPAQFCVLPTFPLTASGKLLKRDLLAHLA